MWALKDKQWKVIEKSSGKTICILTAVETPGMFWIKAVVTPDELFEQYRDQFIEASTLDPDNDNDIDRADKAMYKLLERIDYCAIHHEHEIEQAILHIFEDMTAHFRAIWKET